MWPLFHPLQPPPDDSRRPNLKNIVFINNNVMKCKQKVNTPPIPSLLTSQQEGIFGDSIDNGGKPFEKFPPARLHIHFSATAAQAQREIKREPLKCFPLNLCGSVAIFLTAQVEKFYTESC